MPEYYIDITRTAEKQLDKIHGRIANQLFDLIHSLASNPRPQDCKKLKKRNAWRVRKGAYRIIYEIHDNKLLVIVIGVGHRKDVYRK